MLLFEKKLQKGIKNLEWGLPYSKFSFREVYRQIYSPKSRVEDPITHRRKTKYIQKYTFTYETFEYCYPLSIGKCLIKHPC